MKVSTWLNKDSTSRKIERQLPKYRILARVGQGQFGQVFCAVERQTGQLVALKELTHRRLSTSKFLRELGSLLTLQHRNIVTCRAFEQTATARYLVMDYCEGGTLRELLEQSDSLNLREALELMQGMLSGLEQAHHQGIIHCDIKPENILLGLNRGIWLPRLSDFGIARRLSEVGQGRKSAESADGSIEVVGAPAYSSPETFYGIYSRAADIYAMGIVLFELLLGYRPFTGMPERLMWAHLNQPLEIPPMLPAPLQGILKQALAKLKGRRYKTAAEMSGAILRAIEDPQMQSFMSQSLPFRPPRDSTLDLRVPDICIIHQEQLPPISQVCSGNGYLYACSEQKTLLIWPQSSTRAVAVNFPEPIGEICPTENHCLVSTRDPKKEHGGSIYWLSAKNPRPQVVLSLASEFTLASDPIGQWLVVAGGRQLITNHQSPPQPPLSQGGLRGGQPDGVSQGLRGSQPPTTNHQSQNKSQKTVELRFYGLGKTDGAIKQPSVKLWRSISLSVGMLPQLMFVDRRHIVAVWRNLDPKKPQTIFNLYSRRGNRIGSVRSPLLLSKVISTDTPSVLFGISDRPRPALWRIQLIPLQLKRIPLNTTPTCLSPVPGGCLLADTNGEIIFFDCEGYNHGNFQFGFQAPLGLAAWGVPSEAKSENPIGLAGITTAAPGSCISLVKLKPKHFSDRESSDF